MNTLQLLTRSIIKKSFHFSVWIIEWFYDMMPFYAKITALRNLPKGSLGKDIADCLDANNLRLIPNFESHDLKHTLLNYAMTPEDEIRMQAFMIGNGNCSLVSFLIFTFGAILLPDLWPTFYADFEKGRQTTPIKTWTIETYGDKQTADLRNEILLFRPSKRTYSIMRKLIKAGAVISVVVGFLGMLYCVPFLFSSATVDVIGAGFPFIAGAILVSGGLITLSNLIKQSQITA